MGQAHSKVALSVHLPSCHGFRGRVLSIRVPIEDVYFNFLQFSLYDNNIIMKHWCLHLDPLIILPYSEGIVVYQRIPCAH